MNQGPYLHFEDDNSFPSNMPDVFFGTEGDWEMDLFGVEYPYRSEFDPTHNITTVPNALYHELKSAIPQDYKVRDGVYEEEGCWDIHESFQNYKYNG